MSNKILIWCAHPDHDEVLPNGKKHFCKSGTKPSHPKGKRSINEQWAEFINIHHQAILNGRSKKLSKGDCYDPCHKHYHRYTYIYIFSSLLFHSPTVFSFCSPSFFFSLPLLYIDRIYTQRTSFFSVCVFSVHLMKKK